jgi:hypothetical protein
MAPHTDPNLLDAWGMAELPDGGFIVADALSGFVTFYSRNGKTLRPPITDPAAPPRGAHGAGFVRGRGENPRHGCRHQSRRGTVREAYSTALPSHPRTAARPTVAKIPLGARRAPRETDADTSRHVLRLDSCWQYPGFRVLLWNCCRFHFSDSNFHRNVVIVHIQNCNLTLLVGAATLEHERQFTP